MPLSSCQMRMDMEAYILQLAHAQSAHTYSSDKSNDMSSKMFGLLCENCNLNAVNCVCVWVCALPLNSYTKVTQTNIFGGK